MVVSKNRVFTHDVLYTSQMGIYGISDWANLRSKRSKPKYTFSRAKWYTCWVKIAQHEDVIDWCTEHFGKAPKHPDAWCRWYECSMFVIRFRDEDDAIMFKLRWGGG